MEKKRVIIFLVGFLLLLPIVSAEDKLISTWVNININGTELTLSNEEETKIYDLTIISTNYTYGNGSNYTITNKTITWDKNISIGFEREMECAESTAIGFCLNMTQKYQEVFEANTKCSFDNLLCENKNNENEDYKTKYLNCTSYSHPVTKSDNGNFWLGGLIGLILGVLIMLNRGTSRRGIDKMQPGIQSSGQVSENDFNGLFEKGKDIVGKGLDKVRDKLDGQ